MRLLLFIASCLLVPYLALSAWAGWFLLPPMLLQGPLPVRTEGDREAVRRSIETPGARWQELALRGGEGRPLEVWWLRRPAPRGVVIYLHGFGDDAWGTLARAADLPEWDAVGFTFRGRDRHPEIPATLGGWERRDVEAVIATLETRGFSRSRMILAAWSQGSGVALLALDDLEKPGAPLGGALLECPFEDLRSAARDRLRLALGPWELLARPAEAIALRRAGRLAHFDPVEVSPRMAAHGLRTPLAFVTGDTDHQTPLAGVRAVAEGHADLIVVPGAGHCEASGRLPGGWQGWAQSRLQGWGVGSRE